MIRFSLRAVVLCLCLLTVALFAITSFRRVMVTGTQDSVETVLLEQAQKVSHGEPIYGEPPPAQQPAIMPGFAYAVSWMAHDAEPALWHVRALALLSLLAIVVLVVAIIRLEGGSLMPALAGGSFVVVGYGFMTIVPGMARPETLMLLLVLLGFMVLRFVDGILGALLGAFPIAAAFFVDSQAGWFAAGAYFSIAIEDNRRLAAFALMMGVLLGGGYIFLSRFMGPWFNFTAWDEPLRTLRLSPTGPLHFVGSYLLGTFGIWTVASLLSFAMPTPPWYGKSGIWMCMTCGSLAAGIAATQTTTFGPHSLLPSIICLSVVGPMLVQRVARHLAEWSDPDRPGGETVVLTALTLQYIAVLATVPTSRWLPAFLELTHWRF